MIRSYVSILLKRKEVVSNVTLQCSQQEECRLPKEEKSIKTLVKIGCKGFEL